MKWVWVYIEVKRQQLLSTYCSDADVVHGADTCLIRGQTLPPGGRLYNTGLSSDGAEPHRGNETLCFRPSDDYWRTCRASAYIDSSLREVATSSPVSLRKVSHTRVPEYGLCLEAITFIVLKSNHLRWEFLRSVAAAVLALACPEMLISQLEGVPLFRFHERWLWERNTLSTSVNWRWFVTVHMLQNVFYLTRLKCFII